MATCMLKNREYYTLVVYTTREHRPLGLSSLAMLHVLVVVPSTVKTTRVGAYYNTLANV